MLRSATFKEVLARQKRSEVSGNAGIGRSGVPKRPTKMMLQVGIHNARWRGDKLPKGANKKRNGLIGSQRTGR